MTTVTEQLQTPMDPGEPVGHLLYRLSVEQYHEMVQRGILTNDDQVELLEGWLVKKMPKNPPHVVTTKLVAEALRRLVPDGWHVATQDPITTDTSEPEPDVVVVRGSIRDYGERHPGPEETALVVEVADSSLGRDRGIKRRVYARANVPVYWIIDVVDRRVEVCVAPSGPAPQPVYRDPKVFSQTESVPVVVDGREVGSLPVASILP